MLKLYEKELLNENLVKLKINFSTLVEKFERENINIIEFASNKSMREKIYIISKKLLEYVTEIGTSATTGTQS